MDYCNINYCQKSSIGTGPEQCLCQYLKNGDTCDPCSQIEEDWNIYKITVEEKDEIGEGKTVSIGNIEKKQHEQLHDLLTENKDLFAQSLAELQQSNIEEHIIITEEVPPITSSSKINDRNSQQKI